MERGLGDADYWSIRQFSRGMETGIAETGQYIGVAPFSLAFANLVHHANRGQCFIAMRFDGNRSHGWAYSFDAYVFAGGCARRLLYGMGHGPRSVWIDDFDFHVDLEELTSQW